MPRQPSPWYRKSKDAWYVKVDRRHIPLRVRGRNNREAAVRAWHRLMAGFASETPTTRPTAVSVREWQTAFLDYAETRLKPNTLVWYRHALNHFNSDFATRPLASISPGDVERWSRSQRTWGDTSRAHALGILQIAFRWAVRRGWLERNPLEHVTKPRRRSRGEDAVITAADHQKLLAAATPQFQFVLQVLHATGARPAEVAAITAENFDPVNGIVRLREHKTVRHGKRRVLYLTQGVVRLLRCQRERYGSGSLLRNRLGNPWTKDAIVLSMRRLRGKTGVSATAYSYRHTYATDALASGVPDAHVAELLGHSSTAMLHRHYSHLGTRTKVLAAAARAVR